MTKTSPTKTPTPADVEALLTKVKKLEKGEQLDLSSDEDLSIGVMNLISIEEHLFFTSQKTGKTEYLDVLAEVRDMRKTLLKKLIKDYEGEVWCISKHLLAASMRFMEVGTKALGKADKVGAQELFQKAYQLYSLFWGLNLGLTKTTPAGEIAETNGKPTPAALSKSSLTKELPITESPATAAPLPQSSLFQKLGEIVKKTIDCCRE